MKAEIQTSKNKKSSLFDLMVKKAVSRKNTELIEKSEIEDILLTNQPSESQEINQIARRKVEERAESLEGSILRTEAVDKAVYEKMAAFS